MCDQAIAATKLPGTALSSAPLCFFYRLSPQISTAHSKYRLQLFATQRREKGDPALKGRFRNGQGRRQEIWRLLFSERELLSQLYYNSMGSAISTLVFQPPPATFLHNKKHFWLQTRNQHRIPVFHVDRRCEPRQTSLGAPNLYLFSAVSIRREEHSLYS